MRASPRYTLAMKIYTRTGDDGTTGLLGGNRVEKDSPRVGAYGAVDELNSHLGLAAAVCNDELLSQVMLRVQHELFDVGAELASNPDAESARKTQPRITDEHIAWLESRIDEYWNALPPLKQFILPGGCDLAARLHVARTVCRRAERLVLSLSREETVQAKTIIYLNRLSDLLFAMARRANQSAGVEDVVWESGDSSS